MDIRNLIKMANQISDFFESHRDLDEAAREILLHFKKFWAPQMRAQLLEHALLTDGSGLNKGVLAALYALRDERKSEKRS
ncbi:formate dehydrogenase subunit delta [Noviherbaspirillum denitrificans]|uniref:Formate dehydrogenase n=1 Tax=Noviherbaspirillum denitrificans TaxID=1968433 RepID=A0A254TIA5_9BURK|nr:formate dehydrogenase subunit delta [Noviherbaspirillum denitrificans]OWW20303.1 hypothetical protein AYR66_13175 [Noviherbaspirillum denitrificans]